MQLYRLLQTDEQKIALCQYTEPLGHLASDDFCLACVAYIRFGIRRRFENRVMHLILTASTRFT